MIALFKAHQQKLQCLEAQLRALGASPPQRPPPSPIPTDQSALVSALQHLAARLDALGLQLHDAQTTLVAAAAHADAAIMHHEGHKSEAGQPPFCALAAMDAAPGVCVPGFATHFEEKHHMKGSGAGSVRLQMLKSAEDRAFHELGRKTPQPRDVAMPCYFDSITNLGHAPCAVGLKHEVSSRSGQHRGHGSGRPMTTSLSSMFQAAVGMESPAALRRNKSEGLLCSPLADLHAHGRGAFQSKLNKNKPTIDCTEPKQCGWPRLPRDTPPTSRWLLEAGRARMSEYPQPAAHQITSRNSPPPLGQRKTSIFVNEEEASLSPLHSQTPFTWRKSMASTPNSQLPRALSFGTKGCGNSTLFDPLARIVDPDFLWAK